MQIFFFTHKIIYVALITVLLFIGGAHVSYGASIYIHEAEGGVYALGDEIAVTVYFDTDNEHINALEGSLVYDDTYLKLISINDSNSFITSWIEPPREYGSSIRFSGIAVGGFSGRINPKDNTISPGIVFQATFLLAHEGIGSIHFENVGYFLNNPSGEENIATSTSYLVTILGHRDTPSDNALLLDKTPPEEFSPLVTKDPLFFDGKYVLIFDTKDKNSGMSHYEIKEGKNLWIQAESPYLLQDQTLRSRLWIKAVDEAGNTRIATIRISDSRTWYILGCVLCILILLFFLKKWYFRKIDSYIENNETR